MTFEEFWKENYEKVFGTSEPYYGIASYAFEKGQENCNCVHTDNSKVIEGLLKENEQLKQQVEKMKRCDMCKYSTRLGYCKIRQRGGVCENHDNWEMKEDDR